MALPTESSNVVPPSITSDLRKGVEARYWLVLRHEIFEKTSFCRPLRLQPSALIARALIPHPTIWAAIRPQNSRLPRLGPMNARRPLGCKICQCLLVQCKGKAKPFPAPTKHPLSSLGSLQTQYCSHQSAEIRKLSVSTSQNRGAECRPICDESMRRSQ
jgi:hypothetical protein